MLKTNGFAKSNLSSRAHDTAFNPLNLSMGVNNEESVEEELSDLYSEITNDMNSLAQED